MDDAATLGGKRILLLEDDTDSRESMVMLLELAGAKVVSTPTAEEALAALQRTEFDERHQHRRERQDEERQEDHKGRGSARQARPALKSTHKW